MLSLEHLHQVLNKEIEFGFENTRSGYNKKITYNPYSCITNLYINGVLHLSLQDSRAVIEAYNNIK